MTDHPGSWRLHWLPVSQRVLFKTALVVWKCVHGVDAAYLSNLCYCHLRSWASAICSDWHSTGFTRPDCNWTTKFRSQRTSHMEPFATSTTVIEPVGECLQAGTEDVGYLFSTARRHRAVFMILASDIKYPDLLTYFMTMLYFTISSTTWKIMNPISPESQSFLMFSQLPKAYAFINFIKFTCNFSVLLLTLKPTNRNRVITSFRKDSN